MSKRPVVLGFVCIVAFGLASVAGLWFLTREQRIVEAPASPPEPSLAFAPQPGPAPALPQAALPVPVPRPVLKPMKQPETQLHVTPLFAVNARLTMGRSASLDFRARRKDSAQPAVNEELTASATKMGERAEEKLTVREMARGVYRVEFTPRDSGQFLVALASRGVQAATVPVVVPDPAEAAEASQPAGAPPERARSASARGRR